MRNLVCNLSKDIKNDEEIILLAFQILVRMDIQTHSENTRKQPEITVPIQHPHYPQRKQIAQPQKQPPKQQKLFDPSETEVDKINKYFQKQTKTLHSTALNSQAQTMIQYAVAQILGDLNSGSLEIKQQVADLDLLIDKKKQVGIDSQKLKRKALQIQLEYLESQISHANLKKSRSREKQMNQSSQQGIHAGNAVLSKTMHKQFIKRLEKQKKEIMAKKKKMEEEIRQKQSQEEKLRRIAQEQKLAKEKQERQKKAIEALEKQKVMKESRIKQKEETDRAVQNLKHKKPLFQAFEERYNNEVALPLLQEKKRKLKQIRDYSRALKVQDLNEHQKQYLRKRNEILASSQARSRQNSSEWRYLRPQKSERLARLLEQEYLQVKLKLQEKKRKIEEKIMRQQEFSAYLKQRAPPKIDPKLAEEVQKRVNYDQKQKLHKIDGRALGHNYLQEVRRMKKKNYSSQMKINHTGTFVKEEDPSVFKQLEATKNITNYLQSGKKTKKEYEEIREKRIEKLINQETADGFEKLDRIKKLQVEAEKLSQQQKRKELMLKHRGKNQSNRTDEDSESLNLLLASIKAKMGIIDIYNKD